jgi:hypothetical protein
MVRGGRGKGGTGFLLLGSKEQKRALLGISQEGTSK